MCLGKGERADFDQCKSCNPGYALNSEKKCEPFQCAVGEGSGCKTCRPQEARTDHDECESCNPGFFLSNSNGAWTCEAYSCTTGEGKECKVCQEKGDRTDHGQCAACNDGRMPSRDVTHESQERTRRTHGYQGYELLSNGKCQPFTCKTGLGMGCKARLPRVKRTIVVSASSASLLPVLPGQACRPSLKLTAADQCAQCNEGRNQVRSRFCSGIFSCSC